MRVLVTGPGRGGTNLLTEYVKITECCNFTNAVEDREFFTKTLPENYGTKLSTEHKTFTPSAIAAKLEAHDDLIIFFSIRHPVDLILSKIYRGRPGGDGTGDMTADDATTEGAYKALGYAMQMHKFVMQNYPQRCHLLKMESIIRDNVGVAKSICKIVGVDYKPHMANAHTNNRNQYQKKRYGQTLSHDVLDLHSRVGIIFDGYFRDVDLDYLMTITKEHREYWNYD